MTVRERVIASRLIEKIERQQHFAEQINLKGSVIATGVQTKESEDEKSNER